LNSSPKINVLQVVDKLAIRGSPIHGVSRLLINWWPAFKDTDVDMSLCVLRGSEGGGHTFNEHGIEFIDLDRSKFDPRTITDLIALIRRKNIHVLHCHGYGATTLGRIAGLLARRPVIIQEHMVDSNIPSYQSLADRFLAPATTLGIAVSTAVRRFMHEGRALPLDKIKLVYNAIPSSFIKSYSREELLSIAAGFELDLDKPIVGIVGRLDPVKAHRDFILAGIEVAKNLPEAQFVIVGDGDLAADLEAFVSQQNFEGGVKFLGHQENILAITSMFDVYVCCSLSEGLPMSIVEAMALSKPVVGTRVGGIPEIVEDGVTGLLVESGQVDQLANAIGQILSDKELAKRLGVAGLDRCKSKFLVGQAVNELSSTYRSVARLA